MPSSPHRKLNPERVVAQRLGRKIQQVREEKKLTQKELACLSGSGLYRQLIVQIEQGKRLPNVLQIKAIAGVLGADWIQWLVEIIIN